MSAITNYVEPKIRSLNFGNVQWTGKPTTFYIGWFTSAGSDTGPGTEYTGNGYQRKSVVCNNTNWTVTGATVENAVAFKWPAACTANWEGITHFGIFDKATGGNLLFYGQLKETTTFTKFSTANIPAGEISLTLDGSWGTYSANKTLKYLFYAQSWTNIATHYFAYGTNADADQIYGEPVAVGGATATGYTRGSMVNSTAKWPGTSGNPDTASNASSIANFPDATADQGQFSYQAILDAAIQSATQYDTSTTSVTGATYTQSGTVITVSKTSHGLLDGDAINMTFSTGTAASGYYTVTSVTDANTFVLTATATASTSGNATYVPAYITITKSGHGLSTTNAQTGAAQHVDLWFKSASSGTYPISRRYYVASVPSSSTFRVNINSDETQTANAAGAVDYSAANLLFFTGLTSAITINSTDTTAAPVGAVTVQFD